MMLSRINEYFRNRDEASRITSVISGLVARERQLLGAISGLEETIEGLKKKRAEAKKELEGVGVPCHVCNAACLSYFCPQCGQRIQQNGDLPFVRVAWEIVAPFLHSVANWGEPSKLAFTPDAILLPWPEEETVEFVVGGVEYEWGRKDDDDHAAPAWLAYLQYEHPILGHVELVNLINDDGDHELIDENDDRTALDGGDASELADDTLAAVRQSLTALYLYLQNERVIVPLSADAGSR